MQNLTSNSYWEDRAKQYQDSLEAVLVDVKAQRHEDIVKNFLSRFSSMSALDVACGYGRF